MKDTGIFSVVKKNAGIFFGYCTFHQLKSTVTVQFAVGVGFFWVNAINIGIFLGRQILKLKFFLV